MNRKQILIVILALMAAVVAVFGAGAGNVNVTNPANRPVPVNVVTRAGASALTEQFYAVHITSAGTTTVTSATCYVSTVVISCSNAGTTYTIKIQNKEGTPKILIPQYTLTVPTNGAPNTNLLWDEPVIMTGGVDLVTTGTPGVVDVWVTYWQ